VNAVRRVCFKELPDNLILALKRFEFNYDTMQKLKVNDLCTFPDYLDMEQFTYQGLQQKENRPLEK